MTLINCRRIRRRSVVAVVAVIEVEKTQDRVKPLALSGHTRTIWVVGVRMDRVGQVVIYTHRPHAAIFTTRGTLGECRAKYATA